MDIPYEKAVNFFHQPENLKELTPKDMGFVMTDDSDREVKNGSIFKYKFKKYGLPMSWASSIEGVVEGSSTFIDRQISGPYSSWIHEHSFAPYKNGTLIIDKVKYRLPLTPLSSIALPLIKKDIAGIFSYRKKALNEIFK